MAPMLRSLAKLAVVLGFEVARAAPLSERDNYAPVTALTAAQVSALTPFAYMTSASYCSLSSLMDWDCGTPCSALPGMVTIVAGGDDSDTPDYYVGYYPADEAIVISHRGTNTDSLVSLLEDAEAVQVPMDPAYFPTQSAAGLEVHDGFQSTFELTATTILDAVESGLSTYGASKVYVTGHSLGAAIALFDAIYLTENLPSSITLTTTLFGLPRVGNPAFASYVTSNFPSLQHVVNDNDIVPHLPFEDMGYEHPAGEIWITQDGGSTYDACPGEENENCADGVDPLDYNTDPHDGPYAGVTMGSGCS